MRDLEIAIGVQAVALEQRVAVRQVKQRARGNRHHQAVVGQRGGVVDRIGTFTHACIMHAWR